MGGYTMKLLGSALLLVSALSVTAQANQSLRKISPNKAEVIIYNSASSVQAAQHLDGKDNQRFVEMMLADQNSSLSKLVREIENEECGTTSTSGSRGWIENCGRVELTSYVRTSFERAGWMGGASGYTFFVGFRSLGSGQFFDVTHLVRISEGTEAQTDDDGEYKGVIVKTLEFSGAFRILN